MTIVCCRYFFIQHHITPQIRHAKGFSLGPDGGAGYTVASMYPEEGGSPSQATLNLMRNQTDEVRAAQGTDHCSDPHQRHPALLFE